MEVEQVLDLDIFADDEHRLNMQSPTTDVDKSDLLEPITPMESDKLHDDNELELLKSQDSVLWGDEDSDDEDFLTNNSYLTANDLLSQRSAAFDVPSLNNEDMKNIFGSPASVKSSGLTYGTDSEHESGNNSDDDEDDQDSPSRTAPVSKKEKKVKEEKLKKSAVMSEIEAVKKIESGPSEAELRRRQLIEIDQDEMEDRIERLNKVALKAMSSSTGWSVEEQKKQLKQCREYLMKFIRLPDFVEIVEESIDKHNSRVYAIEGTPAVDAIAYLRNDTGIFSDDEKEVESKKPATTTEIKVEVAEGMIELSDSEDDSDSEDVVTPSTVVATVQVKSEAEIKISDAAVAAACLLERRKALYMAALNKPKTSRAMLLTSLRQKVHDTAKENYCTQNKIQVEQLSVRLEIFEKSRILVELLKERHESRTLQQREARRLRYQSLNNDDEEEFDADDEEFEEGQFLTAAEKEALMIQLNKEREEESEEEDNNDDIMDEIESDHDSDDGEASDGSDHDDIDDVHGEETIVKAKKAPLNSNPTDDASAAANDLDDDEEDQPVKRVHSSSFASRKFSTAIEGETDTQLDDVTLFNTNDVDDDDVIAPTVTYGRKQSSSASRTEATQDTLVDSDTEENVAPEPVEVKKPKVKSGNALFRLGLEEEARRHRNQKKNGLVDDEAFEEEEEGHQAGLGDFGFGTMSSLKEMDEEREALKLRKGDLDHIVDDVSDGEGDDEAAVRARVDMEIREDRERTKAVIQAVTEGHDGTRNKKNKSKYSFDRLVADKKRERFNATGDAGEGGEVEEELDEEEMLQRGLQDKYERERTKSNNKRQFYNSDDSDSEEDEEGSDTEDNIYNIMASETLTEEQKKVEIDKINALREAERIEALRRKQMESYTKMRRELRRRQQYAAQSSSSINNPIVKTSTLTFQPLEPSIGLSNVTTAAATPVTTVNTTGSSVAAASIKRRTSLAPKHITGPTVGNAALRRPPSASLSRTSSLNTNNNSKLIRAPSSTMYKGELNQTEVMGGYGMGMAVSGSRKMGGDGEGFSGLFSAVTGIKRGASDTLPLPGGLKRSFSSSVSKRTSSLTSTVASHQFVFTGAGESSMHGTATMMDSNFSNTGVSKFPSHSVGFGGGESSLFAKLGSRADQNRSKK